MIRTGSLAQKGNFLSALNVKREKPSSWIVDSGASDHMTGDAKIFNSYSPYHENFKGSRWITFKSGWYRFCYNLEESTLNLVLLVPNLNCNLPSISKLTRELNCVTKFSQNSCEFQDLDSGNTIGNAEMCLRLYFLQVNDSPKGQTHRVDCVASQSQCHKTSLFVASCSSSSSYFYFFFK